MNAILRVLVAAVAVALFMAWVAPAMAQPKNARGYAALTLVSPADGATVHDNAGDVALEAALEPPLDVAAGHRLGVMLADNALPLRSTDTRFMVHDIERGEHRLRVFVIDGDGTRLIESEPRTIHVWRASRLFPNRP